MEVTPIMPSFVPNTVAQNVLLWIYTPKRSGPGIEFRIQSEFENGFGYVICMHCPWEHSAFRIPHGEQDSVYV